MEIVRQLKCGLQSLDIRFLWSCMSHAMKWSSENLRIFMHALRLETFEHLLSVQAFWTCTLADRPTLVCMERGQAYNLAKIFKIHGGWEDCVIRRTISNSSWSFVRAFHDWQIMCCLLHCLLIAKIFPGTHPSRTTLCSGQWVIQAERPPSQGGHPPGE